MLTFENIEREFTSFKIDKLGYLFCGDCIGFGNGGEIEYTRPDCNSHCDDDAVCDGCRKPRDSWPTITREVRVEVEHFTCKIF